MTDIDSKEAFWAKIVAVAPGQLISQLRSEAETILQENNTNIFRVEPENVYRKPQLYLAEWYDHGCKYRYERRGDWEVLVLYYDYNERIVWKHKDMILDFQKDITTWEYLKTFQQGDTSVKILDKNGSKSFGDEVIKYTDEKGTEKTFQVQNGGFLDRLLNISSGVLQSSNAWRIAILDDKNYSGNEKEKSVGLKQISEKRTDRTTIEYEQNPWLSTSLFKANCYDGLSIQGAIGKINDDIAKEKLHAADCYVLKKVSKGAETTFYINDVYLGKAVVDKENPKGEYLGLGNLESVTHCYDCNGKLVEEYVDTAVDSKDVRRTGISGYSFLNTYFDNGNIKMHKMLGGEPLTAGNASYYDPNNSGKCIAYTEYNGSLMCAFDNPESRKAMKDRFEKAMETNDLNEAKLALNMVFQSLRPFGSPKEFHTDNSLLVRNDLRKFAIKVLGDGKIAIGGIYEDRHWVGETFFGNGIEWFWKASAVVVDLQDDACGIVAECHTGRINVRHRTNPDLDLWNKLDDNFMEIDEKTGKLTVGLRRKWLNKWEDSASIDLKQKIAEYDKLVASIKHDTATPEHKKGVAKQVEKFKEATKQQTKKNIGQGLDTVQQVRSAGHASR